MSMETIFTILIFILPIVFKLIGKKLEQAGQQSAQVQNGQEKIEDWAEVLRRHLELRQQGQDLPSVEMETPAYQTEVQETVPPQKTPARPVVKSSMPILKEEPQKDKVKLDKKKLIVYSEIMKPKYTE